MRWYRPATLIATAGALVLPVGALIFLESVPGRGSAGAILRQVAIVAVGVVAFALLLARLIEQMNAGRVGRWLESPEGRSWLESLPEEERAAFLERFDDFR
jgi:hypothetical protein